MKALQARLHSTSSTRLHRLENAMNLQKFPRYPLTFGPRPSHRYRACRPTWAARHLYAKREDCNSGLAFGGNKTRKMEYLIPEAIAGGYDTLVSIGGIQSNQTRQVAAVAAHLGMKCVLVQENWVNYSDAVYDRVGNIEMSRIMGADVRLDAAGFDIGIRPSWEQAMDDVKKAGGKLFPIPRAALSTHTAAWALWALPRKCASRKRAGFQFDYIVVCSVTGSTQAGMVVGFAADGRARKVIGIDALSQARGKPMRRFCALPRTPPSWWNWDRRSPPKTWCWTRATAALSTACPMKARSKPFACARAQEGMLTDPVYEGKSMHGMIDRVRRGEFPKALACCMRTWEGAGPERHSGCAGG